MAFESIHKKLIDLRLRFHSKVRSVSLRRPSWKFPSVRLSPIHWPQWHLPRSQWLDGLFRMPLGLDFSRVRSWGGALRKKSLCVTRPLQRVSRIVCAFLSLTILASGAFVGALYAFVTPEAACRLLADFSRSTLLAEAHVEGPVELKLLPRLSVKFPRIQFKRLSDGSACGNIEAASVEVSLWSLPFGVVRVENAHMNAPTALIELRALQAAAQGTTPTTFPKWLLIQSVSLSDASLELSTGDSKKSVLTLNHLSLNLGQLSPEMRTPAEVTGDFQTTSTQFGTLSGQVRITTTLAFSASAHRLTWAKTALTGAVKSATSSFALDAHAEKLVWDPSQASGKGLVFDLTPNNAPEVKTHIELSDFLLEKNSLTSPKLQVSRTENLLESRKTYSLSSALTLNTETLSGHMKDILGTLSESQASPEAQSKQTVLMTASGQADINLERQSADMTLVGTLAKSPFTYTGHWEGWSHSTGKFQLESLDLARFRLPFKLSSLGNAVFDTDLRIGNLQGLGLQARQLQARLQATSSGLQLSQASISIAEGRAQGQAQVSEDGKWSLEAHLEGIALEKALQGARQPWLLSGSIDGTLRLAGTGVNQASLHGKGKLTHSHGSIRGLTLADMNAFLASGLPQESVQGRTSTLPFDVATYEVDMQGHIIRLENLSVSSAQTRMQATVLADTEKQTVQGAATFDLANTSAPNTTPMKAAISGLWSDPVWILTSEGNSQGQAGNLGQRAKAQARSLWRRLRHSLGL